MVMTKSTVAYYLQMANQGLQEKKETAVPTEKTILQWSYDPADIDSSTSPTTAIDGSTSPPAAIGCIGAGIANGLVLWTGYRFVMRQSLRCRFEPRLVPLSKAPYHTCFICGQRCKWWSRRPKLTSSVISDVKQIIYIFFFYIY